MRYIIMNNAITFIEDELLKLAGVEEERKEWNHYTYNGAPVPRVSHILSQCTSNDYLIQWAANIGRRKYDAIREKALTVGTIVHELVDDYLTAKYTDKKPFSVDYSLIDDDYKSAVYNAFENFKLWEARLNSFDIQIEEIYGFEIPIITPWYGGTIDAIFKINGIWYLIDFKTSKQIDESYILQTAAYLYGIDNGFLPGAPEIGGIGIIRMDKSNYGVISDLFLNKSNPYQNDIITKAQECFRSYLNAYYRTINHVYNVQSYSKLYNPKEIFEVK